MNDEQRFKIINYIIKSEKFSYLNISREGRFLRAPFKTLFFYSLYFLNSFSPAKIGIKAKTVWGDAITGYSSASIGPVFYLGFQDAGITIFLLKFLRKGDIFIDVGSNIGYYALLAKTLVGPRGRVFAFEPTPKTFLILKKNVESFENICILSSALSDKTGVTDFIDYGSRFSAFNTFSKRTVDFLKDKGRIIRVKTETLDNFCQQNRIRPGIIKIDAEGAENLVLRGADFLLREHRPTIIFEVGGEKEWGKNNREALAILTNKNYKIFEADAKGEISIHRFQEVYAYNNLIAIPKEKVDYFQ